MPPSRPAAQQCPDASLEELMRLARRQLEPEEAAALDRAAWRQAVEEFLAARSCAGPREQLSGRNK